MQIKYGKKGISTVVATVLIILIIIVAAGIIWIVVLPIVKENISSTEQFDVDLFISTSSGYTYWDSSNEIICVQVKRGSDEANLSGVEVVFSFAGNTKKSYFASDKIPAPNEASTECFDLTGLGEPDSISIAPVFISGSKTITGQISSEIENIPTGGWTGDVDDLRKVDDEPPELGDCTDEDEDGYGSPASLDCTNSELDCDDTDESINPGATEICDDGLDNDCDGDADGDDGNCIIEISACQVLSQKGKIYILTEDISDDSLTDNCFNITTKNVTLDCDGYDIQSDNDLAGVFSNQINTTIKNCNITMGGGSGAYGIRLDYANESYIFNNILSNQKMGLYLNKVDDAVIKNNILNSNTNAIHALQGNDNKIQDNYVCNNTALTNADFNCIASSDFFGTGNTFTNVVSCESGQSTEWPVYLDDYEYCGAIDSDYVSWWRFEGNTDDESGNDNDGTLIGDASVSGNVLNLDGDEDYMSVDDADTLDPGTSDWSVVFWANSSVADIPEITALVAKGQQGLSSPIDWFIGFTSEEKLLVEFGNLVGVMGKLYQATGSSAISNVDSWHHYAVIYDRDQAEADVYVDGAAYAVGTVADDLNVLDDVDVDNSFDLIIGADSSLNFVFNGQLDEVMIYDKVLTQAEVRNIKAATRK